MGRDYQDEREKYEIVALTANYSNGAAFFTLFPIATIFLDISNQNLAIVLTPLVGTVIAIVIINVALIELAVLELLIERKLKEGLDD